MNYGISLIGKSLYYWNKEAKKIRDNRRELKDQLFGYGLNVTISDTFGYYGEVTHRYANDIIYSHINELEHEDNRAENFFYENDGDVYFSDEFQDEFSSYEEIHSVINNEIYFSYAEVTEIEEKVSEAHNMLHELKYQMNEIYDIKTEIVKKYGTFITTHIFEQDDVNLYDYYTIGDYGFHIMRDWYIDEDTDDYETLTEISSEMKLDDTSDILSLEELKGLI